MRTLAERFNEKWIPEPNSGCWLWLGAVKPTRKGLARPVMVIARRGRRAARVSWQLHKGDIPPKMLVCHHCDVPMCVNPDHLFLGTPDDNIQDCIQKGRRTYRRGEKHHNSLLTEEAVREIRSSLEISAAIAPRFGVSSAAVRRVRQRRNWGHIA